jgi:hypothetical protein
MNIFGYLRTNITVFDGYRRHISVLERKKIHAIISLLFGGRTAAYNLYMIQALYAFLKRDTADKPNGRLLPRQSSM